MAAPKIRIKRSSVAGKVPHYPNTLDLGEFAINTADGKVFIAAGVAGVGVGTTVREVGISTENLLSQSLRVDGDTDFNGNVDVGDGDILRLGDSNDLQIRHLSNGDSAITEGGGGALYVGGSRIIIADGYSSNYKADFTGTAVDLYYNTNKKFETSNTGINVTGNVVSDGLVVDGDTDLNGDLSVSDVASFNHAKFVGVLTSTSFHGNINSTGISTIAGFRFPSSDGDEDQALVTDGNGALLFKTLSGGGGGATGAATTISTGITTATAGQTVFSTPHPHNDGTDTYSHQIFVNGVKMRPADAGASTRDFIKSANSTITFYSGLTLNDEVRAVVYFGHTLEEEYFTATQGQTLFALSGSLSAQKNFKVYVNGVKLRNGTDFGVAAPVTLTSPAAAGDHVEITCDNAEDAFTATAGQASFTPTSTDISDDNMQVYVNGIIQNETADYTIGSPSVTITDGAGLTAGDQVDVVIRRS